MCIRDRLIWTDNSKNLNSNEDQIKDWIRGKSKCDLISDFLLMPGFEATSLFSFSSISISNALSRTRVKHVHFKGTYENLELP